MATNFQDLVAKVKNLVALAPVLGAISRPECASISGFCRQLGYNTSSSMALLLMRGLNIRKTATLLTGNWSVGVGVLWAKISASLCLLVL